MRPALTAVAAIELEKVVAVVGDERACGGLRILEDVVVWEAAELSSLGHSLNIVVARTELLGHDRRDHLVQQELHRVRLCSRQRRSAASASSWLRRIRSSVSSGYYNEYPDDT